MRSNSSVRAALVSAFLVSLVFLVCIDQVAGQESTLKNHTATSVIRAFLKTLSFLLSQKYEEESVCPRWFKEYAMNDTSNDDLVHELAQAAVRRAGFKHEKYFVTSDDGYITHLLRIVNPRADRKRLKQPPVMLLQGGVTDETIWVWGSIRQHHPEKWPRSPHDGPISSWNRSLALTLANNGYDVWLVGTRGSTELNRGHKKYKNQLDWLDYEWSKRRPNDKKSGDGEDYGNMMEKIKYWDYTFDELAKYELPRQIDLVLAKTGARNITLFPISFSSILSLMMVAEQPHYRALIHNSVVMGPIMNNRGTNNLMSFFHNTICKLLPTELGSILVSEIILKKWVRDIGVRMSRRKGLRYFIYQAFNLALAGPSPLYQTFLEPFVMGHILKETGFKQMKHYCQIVTAGRLQKFDHGPLKNKKIYGHHRPPAYELNEADFSNWLLISGGNDMMATPRSVQQYAKSIRRPPEAHIYVHRYNHLDLFAAIDNDVRINLPILNFLERFRLRPAV